MKMVINSLGEGTGAELRSCAKAEVDVLCSPSRIVRTVSVDVKQHRMGLEAPIYLVPLVMATS